MWGSPLNRCAEDVQVQVDQAVASRNKDYDKPFAAKEEW